LGLSRMETYLAIIKVLIDEGLITEKQIMSKAELNLSSPKEYLDFLVGLDLIVKKKIGNKTVYSSTDKAQKLCRYFKLDDDFSIFGGTNITRID
jgi:predicted transcriptional regulator